MQNVQQQPTAAHVFAVALRTVATLLVLTLLLDLVALLLQGGPVELGVPAPGLDL